MTTLEQNYSGKAGKFFGAILLMNWFLVTVFSFFPGHAEKQDILPVPVISLLMMTAVFIVSSPCFFKWALPGEYEKFRLFFKILLLVSWTALTINNYLLEYFGKHPQLPQPLAILLFLTVLFVFTSPGLSPKNSLRHNDKARYFFKIILMVDWIFLSIVNLLPGETPHRAVITLLFLTAIFLCNHPAVAGQKS